jgi:hypothetical protein
MESEEQTAFLQKLFALIVTTDEDREENKSSSWVDSGPVCDVDSEY